MDTTVFPRHEASLHLTHNDHKSYYRTVANGLILSVVSENV